MNWHRISSWAIESDCGWWSIQRLRYHYGIRYRLFRGMKALGEFMTAEEAKGEASRQAGRT